jgi:predicted RNase H-like HicB family nuclease
MRYPVAIEAGTNTTAYGVIVPDLPGCFSAGDTLDEALAAAEEAAAAWIDAALDAGEDVPAPASLEDLRRSPDYAGWIFGVISVDPALLDDTVERVNITLPRRVLKRLDALANAAGESRSGYIAQLTLKDRRTARAA